MKQIYLLIIAFLLTLTSCSFNQIYKDQESDKKDGEQVTQKFYWEILHGSNQDKIYNLFGEKFFEVTDKEKLEELLNITTKIGPVEEYNLSKWETLVVKGTNPKSEYLFTYDVKRGNETTHETFTLEKDKEGSIKIVGYHVNQDL
jgi:hypothetical protein